MRITTTGLIATFVFVLFGGAPSVSLAEGSAGEAEAFFKAKQKAVTKLLASKKAGAGRDALSGQIDTLLDYETLSKNALSDHWAERSEKERTQFVGLLKQLVERSYRKSLRSTLGYRIQYMGSEEASQGVVVHTKAKSKKSKRAPAVSIDYTLHQREGQWRVLDITTDGVSMVRNYRSQFNRILRKDGWPELISRMQTRLKEEAQL